MLLRVVAVVLSLGLFVSGAVADDWVAVKLRGQVLQLVGADWRPLKRGDIVPDDRVVRTLGGGRVDFQRDEEVISLGPQTQIQIFDKTGKRYTTVKQYFGEVAVEAEVQNVQHFEVQTPYLAAVVKGTRFVVKSDKTSSSVSVQRGRVWVESQLTQSTTMVTVGQTANVGKEAELNVSGKGKLPDVVSDTGDVISSQGKPVKKIVTQTIDGVTSVVKNTGKAVGQTGKVVTDTVTEVVKQTGNTVTTTTTTTTGTVKKTVKTVTNLLGGLL